MKKKIILTISYRRRIVGLALTQDLIWSYKTYYGLNGPESITPVIFLFARVRFNIMFLFEV